MDISVTAADIQGHPWTSVDTPGRITIFVDTIFCYGHIRGHDRGHDRGHRSTTVVFDERAEQRFERFVKAVTALDSTRL
jgi:hypothetical protein